MSVATSYAIELFRRARDTIRDANDMRLVPEYRSQLSRALGAAEAAALVEQSDEARDLAKRIEWALVQSHIDYNCTRCARSALAAKQKAQHYIGLAETAKLRFVGGAKKTETLSVLNSYIQILDEIRDVVPSTLTYVLEDASNAIADMSDSLHDADDGRSA